MSEDYIPTADNPLRTVAYVSEITGSTEETVRDWLRAGKLKGRKLQGSWRVTEEELVRFVNEKWGNGNE